MAITIHIYYKGTGDAAKQFAKEMTESGTVDAIRREEGNLCYELFFAVRRGRNGAADRQLGKSESD